MLYNERIEIKEIWTPSVTSYGNLLFEVITSKHRLKESATFPKVYFSGFWALQQFAKHTLVSCQLQTQTDKVTLLICPSRREPGTLAQSILLKGSQQIQSNSYYTHTNTTDPRFLTKQALFIDFLKMHVLFIGSGRCQPRSRSFINDAY